MALFKKKTQKNSKKSKMPLGATYGNTIKKVLGYLKIYKILFAISLILALAVVAGTLYIPILVGNAIDLAIEAGRVDFEGIRGILLHVRCLKKAVVLKRVHKSSLPFFFDFHRVKTSRSV